MFRCCGELSSKQQVIATAQRTGVSLPYAPALHLTVISYHSHMTFDTPDLQPQQQAAHSILPRLFFVCPLEKS
jgi:hypothetical protein